jgi:hypothetical protein
MRGWDSGGAEAAGGVTMGVEGELAWRLGVRQELSSRRLQQPFMRLELVSMGTGKTQEQGDSWNNYGSQYPAGKYFFFNVSIDGGHFSNVVLHHCLTCVSRISE